MNAARVVDVAKRYGAAVALQGLNLEIAAGRVTALLGTNGAGKTTTMSLLLGLIEPDQGQVELFGDFPRQLSGGQQRRVQFALALCGNPDLLCLDEPTVGLDADAVVRNGTRLQIDTAVPDSIVPRLFQADPRLRELEVRRGGLADALSRIATEGLS
jgi:ABC-type multidrug transport system ATPase subunit